MSFRYKLALINLLAILLMGLLTWPLPLDRFTWIKYIDPILLLDYRGFVSVLDRIRITMGLSLNLEVFAVVATVIHYLFVVVIGTLQWFLIGILFERVGAVMKLWKKRVA